MQLLEWFSRKTSIDVDPSAAVLASTTPSQSNTSLASIVPKACLSLFPNPELSPIREQVCSSPI
jgi:hypothetical protein